MKQGRCRASASDVRQSVVPAGPPQPSGRDAEDGPAGRAWEHRPCGRADTVRIESEDATLTYLCSTTYRPTGEHAVHPLEPDLGIEWPADAPLLSARDAGALSWAEVVARGMPPSYDACLAESIYSCRSAPDRPQRRRTSSPKGRTPIE
ncbi:dTDP-4-dehydrorhamnose 3,5-epimerase family protein [Streptomyces luteogriseus]|uniref:dTDP-4-dehydrorhamnose 3,5-epimerase family protein n=1 Tax=Streptomyces luteogriseus TaxID=68233 RepID=UPI0027D85912|nr:dTDP-4-dehydrorhamnose 3,5-epimerase family protein [Streptomyces luteogriseus]